MGSVIIDGQDVRHRLGLTMVVELPERYLRRLADGLLETSVTNGYRRYCHRRGYARVELTRGPALGADRYSLRAWLGKHKLVEHVHYRVVAFARRCTVDCPVTVHPHYDEAV